MRAPSGVITLLTDFGTRDGYVASMKGVILGIAPQVRLVDITHDVAPQAIAEAAYLLQSTYPYFPGGSIHVVVVDPGVGSERRALAVATPAALFVGPDNGILAPIVVEAQERFGEEVQMIELAEPRYWRPELSATFHGRDIFAPVAAHLANGVPLRQMGRAIASIRPGVVGGATLTAGGGLEGHVAHVDRFGNCMTDIGSGDLAKLGPHDLLVVEVAGHRVRGLSRTYSDASDGVLMALVGSNSRLEVAVRNGNAARSLGLERGAAVKVTLDSTR